MIVMDDHARLLAIEAIAHLKARYCRLLDTKDWAGWRDPIIAPLLRGTLRDLQPRR